VLTNLPQGDWNSWERLAERRPDLILVVITGNPDGSTATDYTVNAALGFPWITGPVDSRGPIGHVLPAWDALTGYLAATAILAAELHRVRTGEGQLVRLSLADIALSVASHLGLLAEAQLVEEPRGRYGNALFGSFGRDFSTGDGRSVMVVALTPRQWASLVATTGIGTEIALLEAERGVDLRREGDRFQLREEIAALVEPWVAARTLDEVRAAFDAGHVHWGPFQTVKQLLAEDPRASEANPMLRTVGRPGLEPYLAAGSPLRFGQAAWIEPGPAPTLGEHTDEVLRSWLGLSDAELARLAGEGTIGKR
jgi:2-methylfumaryl-CoA isomerase